MYHEIYAYAMATTSRRICKVVALLLLLPLFPAFRTTLDAPYALIFGLSSITVSRFTLSKEYEESIFPAGNEYTAYFEHLLNHGNKFKQRGSWYRQGEDKEQAFPHTWDRNATTALFLNAVKNVTETLRSELGHEPTYVVVVLPPMFDIDSDDAPIPSVFPWGVISRGSPGRVSGIDDTAGFAYGVEQFRNQGRTAAECPDDESVECHDDELSTTLHLIVNYEKNYLFLAMDSTYFEFISSPPIFGEFS